MEIMEMEEVFVSLNVPFFEDFKLSNYGRLMSAKGKFLKPQLMQGVLKYYARKKKGGAVVAILSRSVAKLVYTHFGGYQPKCEFKVYRRDGNMHNNHIDNLVIAVAGKPTKEQLDCYLKRTKRIVLHCLKGMNILSLQRRGLDVDNIISESLYLVYKYLPKYDFNFSYYGFCRRYVLIAIKREWAHFKNETVSLGHFV